ncbi:putative signal peptide protein [Puccinia sorghi]|uniref:Putative signal peptide protein n=1 Tax=Puccinia sorghi TaxID=27349 RepID=A0A0L6U913_9BASI|nr:putative signal peptide protein [Puccinia sorghi]
MLIQLLVSIFFGGLVTGRRQTWTSNSGRLLFLVLRKCGLRGEVEGEIGLYEMTETASFSSPWITTFCGGVDQSSHISDTHFMRTMATECHHNPNEVISMRLPLDSNLKLSISFTDGEILWESRYFPVVLTGWVWRHQNQWICCCPAPLVILMGVCNWKYVRGDLIQLEMAKNLQCEMKLNLKLQPGMKCGHTQLPAVDMQHAPATHNNRSFLGLSACQLQAVEQVFFAVFDVQYCLILYQFLMHGHKLHPHACCFQNQHFPNLPRGQHSSRGCFQLKCNQQTTGVSFDNAANRLISAIAGSQYSHGTRASQGNDDTIGIAIQHSRGRKSCLSTKWCHCSAGARVYDYDGSGRGITNTKPSTIRGYDGVAPNILGVVFGFPRFIVMSQSLIFLFFDGHGLRWQEVPAAVACNVVHTLAQKPVFSFFGRGNKKIQRPKKKDPKGPLHPSLSAESFRLRSAIVFPGFAMARVAVLQQLANILLTPQSHMSSRICSSYVLRRDDERFFNLIDLGTIGFHLPISSQLVVSFIPADESIQR